MQPVISNVPYHPSPSRELVELLGAESLTLVGVADTKPDDEAEAEYGRWIADGRHGAMTYLARQAAMKYRPEAILPGCRSVVMVAMNYYQPEPPIPEATGVGRVARYAWGRDYHNALGKRLKRVTRTLRDRHPGNQFRALVDASPLAERTFSERAGLSFTGKNTLAISAAYGSWFFLGEILTTVAYPPTTAPPAVQGGCPRGCFRCGSACPTGALEAPHRIDARRCISYLTIEYRGVIDPELRPLMGDWIFGCDRCQEVCPLNVRARVTDIDDFRSLRAGSRRRLKELLTMQNDEAFRRTFSGTPLLRTGRSAMIRNAAIAAANTGATHLIPRLRTLSTSKDAIIAIHARWALDTLSSPPPGGQSPNVYPTPR